jgi:hypothetical protein
MSSVIGSKSKGHFIGGGGSFKKIELSRFRLATRAKVQYSRLRFGLASASHCGLHVHNRPAYAAG